MAQEADPSNGYDRIADEFIRCRSRTIGVDVVRAWARTIPRRGTVLDIGCGSGEPITAVLTGENLAVSGLDASPTMISAFRHRFPDAESKCAAIEEADLGDQRFDGVLAWGLLFLLPPLAQVAVVEKVSMALRPGGRFLFTAPAQMSEWTDAMTGRKSFSLGATTYREVLRQHGLETIGEQDDAGDNHYYSAVKHVRPAQLRIGAIEQDSSAADAPR
jgi:SAM-dependent methyltransferase